MLNRIRKNDTVAVISGKDKGKTGQVISVDLKNDTAIVQDISLVTRHIKAKKAGEKNRLSREEGAIAMSKLMPVCSACNKTCRVQTKILEGEKKVRACHRCEKSL